MESYSKQLTNIYQLNLLQVSTITISNTHIHFLRLVTYMTTFRLKYFFQPTPSRNAFATSDGFFSGICSMSFLSATLSSTLMMSANMHFAKDFWQYSRSWVAFLLGMISCIQIQKSFWSCILKWACSSSHTCTFVGASPWRFRTLTTAETNSPWNLSWSDDSVLVCCLSFICLFRTQLGTWSGFGSGSTLHRYLVASWWNIWRRDHVQVEGEDVEELAEDVFGLQHGKEHDLVCARNTYIQGFSDGVRQSMLGGVHASGVESVFGRSDAIETVSSRTRLTTVYVQKQSRVKLFIKVSHHPKNLKHILVQYTRIGRFVLDSVVQQKFIKVSLIICSANISDNNTIRGISFSKYTRQKMITEVRDQI
ncbi:Hypothetical_protein [Hexamita inflata]|uniref:Hypothetical_protein n=1 Tax=Hexamita inflata TaxID=28002 RepID=A0AA86UNY4_9EUKA|nr:Hypothetical protein HINF_LOCUS53535 [Hexamita inflata]